MADNAELSPTISSVPVQLYGRKLPPLTIKTDTPQSLPSKRRTSLVDTIFDFADSKISPINLAEKLAAKDRKKLQKQISSERKNSQTESQENEGKPEKRHPRRDSIKEHLLKFKIKAGKVFEEVHERLTDDHVSSPVTVLTPTASSSGPFELLSPDDDVSANEERVLSPTLSQTSKKTVSSDDGKASLRSKIRKQAEKVVERKRGSVQLTRRLKRRLTTHQEDMPSELDIENVDSQIEYSIKIGEKFLDSEAPSVFPPYLDQYLFFTEEYRIEKEKAESDGSKLSHNRAEPFLSEEGDLLVEMKSLRISDIENQIGTVNIVQSASEENEEEEGDYDNFRWVIEEQELNYLPAQSWKTYQHLHESNKYSELKMSIDCISLESLGFETPEELLANHLRMLYSEQLLVLRKLENLYKAYIQTRREHENSSLLEELLSIYKAEEAKFHTLLTDMEKTWESLKGQRALQGYSLTDVQLDTSKDNRGTERKVGILLENSPVTPKKELPNDVVELLEKRSQRTFYLSLYYNDTFVGRTKYLRLNKGLHFNLIHIFNMEVHSPLKKLNAIIFEKSRWKNRSIVTIDFPTPPQNSITLRDVIQFEAETSESGTSIASLKGYLSYRLGWTNSSKDGPKRSEILDEVLKPSKKENFHLIPPLCRLVSDEEFDCNIRWDVLEKRFRMKLSSKTSELNRIPLDSSDIDPTLLYPDERQQAARGYKTGIDGHRIAANNYSLNLRRRILERFIETEDEVRYDQIVREEPMFSTGFSLRNILGPPDVSRKLKPMRKEYARQQTATIGNCHLIVNIQSAINLPTRKNGSLQSVVEVCFQNNRVTTAAAIGKHPNWQQTLRLTVETTNIDLRTISDDVEINIYDQTINKLEHDDREPNTVHEQLIRQLTGTIRLPLSTIYSRGKVDGGLRIKLPLLITGYNIPERGSYLKLLIAIYPPMLPPKIQQHVGRESNEPDKILSQCIQWEKSLRSLYDDRRYVATVSDVHGKRTLASRFLHPIRPPPFIENLIQANSSSPFRLLEIMAQIVSYIPFLTDPILFSGAVDLWTTIDQFIAIGCGDEEEHALLLCCWLLYLQYPSYILLGSALPEGDKAAYVLVKTPDLLLLVNPTDGNVYNIDDVMCPLISVSTIISNTNVYGNIQPFTHASQLNFDFTKNSLWKPLFDKDMTQLNSVQPNNIVYVEVSEDSLMELRSSIEREIKVSFDDSRQFAIPQWNLMASRLLREALQEIDQTTSSTIDEKLVRLRESYNVIATAIRIPYRSLQHCVQSVLSLNLHVNSDTSAKFALAVHITPYFNNIVACSIALAVLTLKK